FSSIAVLSRTGKVVASSSADLIGSNLSQTEAYQHAILGQPFMEDAHPAENNRTWVITFAFPIVASESSNNKIIGVLCGQMKASELGGWTERPSTVSLPNPAPYTVLMRSDGTVLSAPRTKNLETFKANLKKLDMKSVALANQGEEGYLVEKDSNLKQSLI